MVKNCKSYSFVKLFILEFSEIQQLEKEAAIQIWYKKNVLQESQGKKKIKVNFTFSVIVGWSNKGAINHKPNIRDFMNRFVSTPKFLELFKKILDFRGNQKEQKVNNSSRFLSNLF